MNNDRTSSSKRMKKRGSSRSIDERLFREAVKIAENQPRIAFYSPVASCILNYWKNAIPRFSISEFLAQLVERELAKAWPQLYSRAIKNLKRKRSKSSRKIVSREG